MHEIHYRQVPSIYFLTHSSWLGPSDTSQQSLFYLQESTKIKNGVRIIFF